MSEFIAYTDLAFSDVAKTTNKQATQKDIDAFLS